MPVFSMVREKSTVRRGELCCLIAVNRLYVRNTKYLNELNAYADERLVKMFFLFLEEMPMFMLQTLNYIMLGVRIGYLPLIFIVTNFIGYVWGHTMLCNAILNNKTSYPFCFSDSLGKYKAFFLWWLAILPMLIFIVVGALYLNQQYSGLVQPAWITKNYLSSQFEDDNPFLPQP